MAFWIFQNLVMTAALAAVVAVICRVWRIGPVARHALWVIVLIKFITPPVVVWPWMAPDPLGLAAIDARASVDESAVANAPLPESSRPGVMDDAAMALIGTTTDLDLNDRGASRVDAAATWTTWALMVWVAGSAALLGIELVRLARLLRKIRSGAVANEESGIVRRVAALSARLGIRAVTVVIVPGTASPVVWGLGRPMLLWPAELPAGSSDACIDGLLVHELAHVKRRDHLVGWIELVAGVIWWWNPLFWFVRSARREQAELACDAWVISALPNGRRAYAESLLALSGAALGGVSSISSSMAAVGIHATSRRVLERRLVMIMKGRTPLRLPFTGLFCLALIGAATLPAWATSAQNPPQPQSQTAPPATPVVAAPSTPARSQPVSVPSAPVQTPSSQSVPVPARSRTVTRESVPVVVSTSVPATVGGVVTSVPVRATVAMAPAVQQTPPPSAPMQRKVVAVPTGRTPPPTWAMKVATPANLTDEGKQLIDSFDKDRAAIEAEVAPKVAARREAAIKALQALQEQYTKAGKLDEAVAIRDYLRAGGPGQTGQILFRKTVK